jgi:hypothetical protein
MPWPPHGQPGPGGMIPGGPYQSGPGHRKPKSKVGLVLIALMLVVVLIGAAGGGMYYFQLGPFGSDVSADRKLGYVVQERFDSTYQPKEGSDILAGPWWTDKFLVRAMPGQLVGYDLTSGNTAYTLAMPDNHYCRASAVQSGKGYIAVLQGTRKDGCRRVSVVDIVNGKVVWSKQLEPVGAPIRDPAGAQYFPRYDHRPAVLGDRLYIPTDKGGHVLKLSDGSRIEAPNPKSKCFSTHYDVIGNTGFAYRNCSRHGGDEGRHLTAFDAAGKVLWKWNLPAQGSRKYLMTGVLSVDPVLIRVFSQNQSQIWQIDAKTGAHRVVVDLTTNPRTPAVVDPCEIAGGDGLHNCSRQVVANGVLFLRHRLGTRSDTRLGLAAYDVRSGKQLWLTAWGEEHDVTAPIGVDGDGAPIAYLLPRQKDPGALLRIDPKTGAMTATAILPRSGDSSSRPGNRDLTEHPDQGVVAWHNNQLAFLKTHINAKDAGDLATLVLR